MRSSHRTVFIALMALGTVLLAGCGTNMAYFRPEGLSAVPRGEDLGKLHQVPPGSGSKGAQLVLSTNGARTMRRRTGEAVAVVRVTVSIENLLDEPIVLKVDSMKLVDMRGVSYPVSYVTRGSLGDDNTATPGEKVSAQTFFELGHPQVISRLAAFTIEWSYSVGEAQASESTRFVRYRPVRDRYYDRWHSPWPFWPWYWGIGIHTHHYSSSSGSWGP